MLAVLYMYVLIALALLQGAGGFAVALALLQGAEALTVKQPVRVAPQRIPRAVSAPHSLKVAVKERRPPPCVKSPKPTRRTRSPADSQVTMPNGLPPNASSVVVKNMWRKYSPVLATLPFDPVRSTHPGIIARPRDDVGGGMGLFTTYGIRKGEVVWAERADANSQTTAVKRSRAWIENLPEEAKATYCHFMYKCGADAYSSLAEFNTIPVEQYPKVKTCDISNYMNHACSPTCLYVDGGERYAGMMVAARDILPGEEITFDYSTSEACDLAPTWDCRCGSVECRGRVTPDDWRRPELQKKYDGHFLPHLVDEMAKLSAEAGTSPPSPLTQIDPDQSAFWWRSSAAGRSSSAEHDSPFSLADPVRAHAMRHVARGAALEHLNRQAAVLLSHHGLRVQQDASKGKGVWSEEYKYVTTDRAIAKGELVMLLPPNRLQWEDQVQDFNQVVQVASTPQGARLFSASRTPDDIDNFLCHSCEPTCYVVIGQELTMGLVASRAIGAGETITFDYEETEDDLCDYSAEGGVNRGGFECNCGAERCRGRIWGKIYKPDYKRHKLAQPSIAPPRAGAEQGPLYRA
jgi:hypothetical protein